MSTNMRARIVSRDKQGQLKPLGGFRVALRGAPPLYGSGEVAAGKTDEFGKFNLTYLRDTSDESIHETLELVVQDIAGRELPIVSMQPVSSSPVFTF